MRMLFWWLICVTVTSGINSGEPGGELEEESLELVGEAPVAPVEQLDVTEAVETGEEVAVQPVEQLEVTDAQEVDEEVPEEKEVATTDQKIEVEVPVQEEQPEPVTEMEKSVRPELVEGFDRTDQLVKPQAAVQEVDAELLATLSDDQEVTEEVVPEDETLVPEHAEEKFVSIDTVDLHEPQGNWLFKRHWWKRANKVYNHISDLVNEAFKDRTEYITRRSQLEHNLFDPFYLNVGITQGELRGLVSFLIEHLKKEGALEELSPHEKELIEKLQEHKAILDQLYRDVQDITELDKTLDAAIDNVMAQLNLARAYKQQAWEYVKEIERELSDQRARELVFEMRALEKNLKDMIAYLEGDFSVFFETLVNTAHEEVGRIKDVIAMLKEQGIDLKKEAEHLEFKGKPDQDTAEDLTSIPVQEGFFARIWRTITGWFS